MWIWSGTPGGHVPPNSEAGKSSGEQQGALGARARLGQHLRGHHSEREPGVDELARQPIGGASTALDDRPEANLPCVADALVQVGEGLAVVEVGGVNDVSGSSQRVGELEESSSLALCVMEEQYLGHDACPTTLGDLETLSRHSARVEQLLLLRPRTDRQDHARPVACTHDDVLGSGGTVEEVPCPEEPLLTLHEQSALPG